ncbi:hypothetical protein Taro_015762 [Colocasia esculenta]|uniref:Uncharacterized protein n=1 Tax=Colocasia esculenta TaxID=4460 RepID=A0A843UQU4_COLES|nr:hypothetical protein [Colocasia esculenta]
MYGERKSVVKKGIIYGGNIGRRKGVVYLQRRIGSPEISLFLPSPPTTISLPFGPAHHDSHPPFLPLRLPSPSFDDRRRPSSPAVGSALTIDLREKEIFHHPFIRNQWMWEVYFVCIAGSTNECDLPTSSKVRKGRGKFKGIEIFKKMKGYNNSKLPVQIDMECRRPFGENVNSLVGEISRLVSIYASFDVPYWRNVPEDRKSKIYEKIWDKFELKVGDEICNNAHRNEEGEEPPAHELWRLTHQKKDGSLGSEYSRQVYETVRDKLEESSSQSCSLAAPTPDEVLTSIVGQRSGRIRGRGCGPRPTPKSVVTAATIAGLQAQVKNKDEEISQMKEMISKQCEDMAVIQEKLENQREELTTHLENMMNQRFMDMMSQFQNRQL